ncbi:ABC transporter substrate-binding protein [Paenibacillus flagellatus]|uniref:ABC transporter substrate-binding protein n=1 Tax=Paenibacillus flagellatus TaxID=2211139 RepID=A0A2V5KPE5_9BACL|nr:sugar ABC transporter substrate-binding protein [Paenibacillus flagellatus]PYI57340.1 hypothetical protein DLM86_02570 [Paenibacillus flagellatus]
MSRIKRRTAVLATAALALVIVFAAWAGGDRSANPGPSAERGDRTEAGDAGDIGGDITVWAWEHAMKAMMPEIDGFLRKYPNVRVHTVMLSNDDAYKRFLLANASNTGAPDVAAIPEPYVGQYIEIGALHDLTSMIRPNRRKIVDTKWPDVTRDGKYYAMPWDSGPVGLFYRRDVFERAGFPSDPDGVSELLATWDDYLRVGKIIKEKTGAYMNALPLESGVGITTMFEYMLSQEGTLYLDKANRVTINSPLALSALKKLIEMNDSGITLSAEPGTRPYNEALQKGYVATVLEAVWMGGTLQEVAPDSSGLWGVAKMPAWRPGGSRAAEAGGSYLGVSRLSTNKRAAWAFIDYMLGEAETVNNMFRRAYLFPALKEAYDDPMYDEPQPFFAGQRTRRFFVRLAEEAKPVYFSDDFRDLREIAEFEAFKAIKNASSPEAAILQMEKRMTEHRRRK